MWTLEISIRRRFVFEMTKLSVWYLRRLLSRNEISVADLEQSLCQRVDLYRFTSLWDGIKQPQESIYDTRWKKVAAELSKVIENAHSVNTDEMEAQCLSLLTPLIEERLPFDVCPPPVRPYSCWTYGPGFAGLRDPKDVFGKLVNFNRGSRWLRKKLGLPPRPPCDIMLHIMNVMVPKSPFDDMYGLMDSLLRLIADAKSNYQSVSEIWCDTWLNQHPKFRPIFPDLWFEQGFAVAMGPTRNWWGQFSACDGDFNDNLANQFRASDGKFPYSPLLCHAPIDLVERHLQQSLQEQKNTENIPEGIQ
jgi:hypothetical protein